VTFATPPRARGPQAGGNAPGDDDVDNLAVADDSVYFSVQSGNDRYSLMSAPLTPGTSSLLIDAQSTITAIAVTATDVYYTTAGTWGAQDGAVNRVPR